MENSERVGSTRPPYLYAEKPVCYNRTWNNRLVQNWERNPQGCILSPCLFNLHEKYVMQNARLDESQVGIKTAGRNHHHLRYADAITLMAEREEELKSLFMRVKEQRKSWFKTQHSKNKDHSIQSLHGK